jgi:hypothetical protein
MKIHRSMYEPWIPAAFPSNETVQGHLRIGPYLAGTALLIKIHLQQQAAFGIIIGAYSIGTQQTAVSVDLSLTASNLEAIACHAMAKLFVIPAIPALANAKCCQTCKHFKSLNRNPTYIGWAFPGPVCYPLIEDVFCLDSYACWEPSNA